MIFTQQKLFYVKIITIMIASFGISSFLTKHLFVNYTPAYRNDLKDYTIAKLTDLKNTITLQKKDIAFQTKEEANSFLQKRLEQLAPGVRASGAENASYVEYDVDSVKWTTYTVTLSSGKVVTVKVPEGGDVGEISASTLEEIYK